jgi:hypothetical protein
VPRTSKSTIKNDPFESIIPMFPTETQRPRRTPVVVKVKPEPLVVEATPKPTPPQEPSNDAEATSQEVAPVEGRQKLTVHLEADIVNRVKNAAYWNPRLTIAKIAERGIRLALKEVEKEHGGAYPQREGELVGGRPIK